LRTSNSFSPAECDQVISHMGVIPKMRTRRSIRGRVVKSRNLLFLGQLQPLVHLDLSRRIRKVGEVHHCCLVVDRPEHTVASFDFNQLYAGGTQLMIESVAM